MKTTTHLLMAILCLFHVSFAIAQTAESPRDTVFYHGTESLNMLILAKDYDLLRKDAQVSTLLADFQSRLKEIQGNIPNSPYVIEYKHQKQLDILQSNKIKSFSISSETGLTENFLNQAIITDPNSSYQVTIGFNDIAALLNTDIAAVLAEIVTELPEKDRYLRYLEYRPDIQSGKAKLTENRPSGFLDMLSLQAGVGANVYRSKFLTDITGEIGLQLNQKGILRNQFYVSNNLLFSFDGENMGKINNFTNIGYRRNLSNQKDKPNWLGVEFGALTKRSGDIFVPNTMRMGMNWQVGKNITVAPQLYFNGFFKQVSPGFRIGIGL